LGYIGNIPAEKYSSFVKQDFTTSATTTYTLDQPVTNENEIALFINFVRQEPTTAYTASGTSLTLTSATSASDDMYCVFLGKAVQTVNPPNSSVGSSQLASDAVTAAKLNDDIISGQTALASEPADTDEFLVSDAGTLKRIDYSLIKGGGITLADQWHITAGINTGSANTDTVITNWTQDAYTGYGRIGTMSESSGIFSFPSTGIYLCELALTFFYNYTNSNYNYSRLQVTTNNSTYNTVSETTTFTRASENYITTSPTSAIIDVTDTSNVKVRGVWHVRDAGNDVEGGSIVRSYFKFIRLGDT